MEGLGVLFLVVLTALVVVTYCCLTAEACLVKRPSIARKATITGGTVGVATLVVVLVVLLL